MPTADFPANAATSTSADWINAMVTRLAHLKGADSATVWDAIPAVFAEVMSEPCDKADGYHCAIAGAVVAALKRRA